jgi:hypothetical protein
MMLGSLLEVPYPTATPTARALHEPEPTFRRPPRPLRGIFPSPDARSAYFASLGWQGPSKYRELVSAARRHKRVHHLRSASEMDAFLNGVKQGINCDNVDRVEGRRR